MRWPADYQGHPPVCASHCPTVQGWRYSGRDYPCPPALKSAAVYDAISYYLDHQQEIEQEIAANRLEALQATYRLEIDDRGFAAFPEDIRDQMISQHAERLFVALYTDEDVTTDLAPALRWRGYMAQNAAEAGNAEMSDEAQLTSATEQRMAILTYNAQDFIPLARRGTPLDASMLALSSPNNSASDSLASCSVACSNF